MGKKNSPKPQDVAQRYKPMVAENVPFDALEWRVAEPGKGQDKNHGSLSWDIRLTNSESLVDAAHSERLYALRALVWTMLHDPRSSKALSSGGLNHVRVAIETGARWMAAEGMSGFAEMDNAASWRFLDHFLDTHKETSAGPAHRPPEITNATANGRLRFIKLIHRQRRALKRFGLDVPNEAPFDGRGIDAVVREDLDLHRHGKLEPIPDEVAIVLMSQAQRWLGVPADDVLALQEAVCENSIPVDESGGRSGVPEMYGESKDVIESFRFSVLEGEAVPWTSLADPYHRTLRDGRVGTIQGRQAVRRLILTVQAAAIIAIQASTGIRASELASFQDTTVGGPLPSCVTSRTSHDGMMELFYCHGVETKTRKKRLEWLVGARPVGSDYLPLPVRALGVLHRLFARWRALSDSHDLMLTFSASKGLPRRAESIGSATSQHMTVVQKEFLQEQCDTTTLPVEAVERFCENDALRGHLWRTTFATFLYRTDPRLLEPISRHFKHLRVAMTETGYVGNDVELLNALDSTHVQQSSRLFYEAIEGNMPVIGGLADSFKDFPRMPGRTLEDYELAVIENDLRLIDFDYGMCGAVVNPEHSRCNTLGGTAHWSKRSPNEALRSPSVCIGCPLFVASRRHLPFWINRMKVLREALRTQWGAKHGLSIVTRRRLTAAETIVARLSGAAADTP